MAASITVHALTHRGAQRPRNEDTIAVGDWVCANELSRPKVLSFDLAQPLVAVVADGMGGHAAGEVASGLAVRHVLAHVGAVDSTEAACALLEAANREVYAGMDRGDGARGMGTTLAGLVLRPEPALAISFNVGDSRAYRYDADDGLVQLSTDDTPGPKLSNRRTAAMSTPIVTQSLGGQLRLEEIVPHAEAEPLVAGRCYLLCSDGVTDLVPAEQIAARLARGDDSAAVYGLFRDAMDAGGRDNISLVLLRVG